MKVKVSAESGGQGSRLELCDSPMLCSVSLGEEDKEDFETNWHQGVESFDDMGLREDILRGIYSYGFKEPSKIQQKGILPVIQGRDTIA